MKLTTEVHIEPSSIKLDHQAKLLSIGSCFAENIGNRFLRSGFNTCVSPFGTIFNPISIERVLNSCNDSLEDAFFSIDGEFYSFLRQKDSGSDLDLLKTNLKKDIEALISSLKNVDVVYITLGTAWVYELENQVVANCYKLPQHLFKKRLLHSEEIEESLSNSIHHIKKLSSQAKVVLTVSPVRHWKDGAIENNVSKGRLLNACYNIKRQDDVEYFPSYEIVMDELRDYRFFKNDLLHPNELAQEFIWEKVQNLYLEDKTIEIAKKAFNASLMLDHKGEDLKEFYRKKMIEIQKQYSVDLQLCC